MQGGAFRCQVSRGYFRNHDQRQITAVRENPPDRAISPVIGLNDISLILLSKKAFTPESGFRFKVFGFSVVISRILTPKKMAVFAYICYV